MTEEEIVNDVEKRLNDKCKNLIVAKEITAFSGRADLVLVGKFIIAIEFKKDKRNWSIAIKQAVKHLKAVDYSYICIPYSDKLSSLMIKRAKKNKVGILLYQQNGKPFKLLLKAPKSNQIWYGLHRAIQYRCQDYYNYYKRVS